jgi:uncharacterized repeat protein (TIGR02543 family)
MGKNAFYGCDKLKTLYVAEATWKSMRTVYSPSLGISTPLGLLSVEEKLPAGCEVVYCYIVKFNANGGKVSPASKRIVCNHAMGTLPKPTRTGHKFLGWYTAKSGGSKISATTKISKSCTFHAHWQAIPYTIEFKANGGKGKMASQTLTYGKAARLRKNAFTRDGCVFLGWATAKSGDILYTNAQAVKNLSSKGGTVTLYGRWARKTYKVAFKANGGKGTMAVQAFTYGTAAALRKNAFTRAYYRFAGWAKSPDGPVVHADGTSVKNLVRNGSTVTLYAKWLPVQRVSFDATGGTCNPAVKEYPTGKIYGSFPEPVRAWHIFLGWFTEAEEGEYVGESDTVPERKTRTLYAHWAERKISLAASGREFKPAAASNQAVAVNAKLDWSAVSDAGWLAVRTKDGTKGKGTIVYDVAANKGNARTGHIIVSGGDEVVTFKVKQQAPVLKLSASKKAFPKTEAKGQKLGVAANVAWKAKSSASWLKAKPASGDGNGTIVYELAENKGAGRAANITVTGGGKTVKFRVEQKGKDGSDPVDETPVKNHYLSIDPTNQTCTAAATHELAVVDSDLSWTAETTNGWITLETASGAGNGPVKYQLAANAGTTRRGKITVTAGSLKAILQIEQTGTDKTPYLLLSPTNRTATAAAVTNEAVWVEANVAWSAQTSDDWIELAVAEGCKNGRVFYTMEANTSDASRTGTITVSGGGVADVFTLTQEGKEIGTGGGSGIGSGSGTVTQKHLTLHPARRTHGNAATNDAFGVESNVRWTARVGKETDWIVLETRSGKNNGTVSYSVAANPGSGGRSGTITVSGNGVEPKTFIVVQSGLANPPNPRPHPKPPVRASLKVSPARVTLDAEEQRASATVVAKPATLTWTVREMGRRDSWIHVTTVNGTGTGPLSFWVEENPETIGRIGYIYLRGANGESAKLRVVQKRKVPYLWVSRTSFDNVSGCGKDGLSFTVKANVDWSLSKNVPWLGGRWTKTGKHEWLVTFDVAENETFSDRPGKIVLSGKGVADKTVVVNQSAGKIVRASNPTAAPYQGGSITLPVQANVAWTASIPKPEDGEWISVQKGKRKNVLNIEVAGNTTGNQRTGTILLAGGCNGVNVKITQKANPVLTVAPKNKTVPFKAARYASIKVTGNVSWTVTRGTDSWITLETLSGKGNGTIAFNVTRNTGMKDRTGYIVVRGGGFTRKVAITQTKEPANLAFYKPKGWPAAAFVTTYKTYTTRLTTFSAGVEPVPCIRYAWINTGKTKAGVYTVKEVITGPEGGTWSKPHNDGLSPNTYTSAHFYWGPVEGNVVYAAPVSPGTYTVTIKLDPGNTVQESNENDNTATVTFTVVAASSYRSRKAPKGKSGARAAEPDAADEASWVVATASGNTDAGAVIDGDENTSWTPGTADGSWLVLTFAEPRDVEDVEVLGDNLPDGTRFLLSEDANRWTEDVPGRAQYVWVVFPASDVPPVVREIRVTP